MDNSIVEKKEKDNKSIKNRILFILKVIGNVIFYIIIIALFIFSLMNIMAGSKNGGFPNIFGKGFLSVQSGSMTKNGNMLTDDYDTYEIGQFDKGDLLYVDVVNESNINNLKIGDVVTFFDSTINNLNTHRIVLIYYSDDAKTIVNSIVTQGDKIASEFGVFVDPEIATEEQIKINYQLQSMTDAATGSSAVQTIVDLSLIKGKVTGISKGAGAVLDNIQANWLWYFVFPVAVLLIFELFMVIKNFMDLKGTKQKAALATDKEALLAEVQAEKEKMRQELLAELKAQQEAEANATKTETVEEVKEETPTEEVEEPTETSEQETKSEEEQQ